MPKSKTILNGDEFKTKTEKMVNLPQSYYRPSKTEKMQYLPRFYYNNYEKIDEGYLDSRGGTIIILPYIHYLFLYISLNNTKKRL